MLTATRFVVQKPVFETIIFKAFQICVSIEISQFIDRVFNKVFDLTSYVL